MICENCGKENINSAKFCKHCGSKMQTSPTISTDPPQKMTPSQSPSPDIPDNSLIKIQKPATFKKPLHYFWICDCSESMQNGGKMAAVNSAIPKAIELISDHEDNSKKAKIFMNALKFSCGANWMYNDNISVKTFIWENLSSDGITDLGQAFQLLAKSLKIQSDGGRMPQKAYPPVIVLITDGYPTDDWEKGLEELNKEFWAKEAVRLAFALDGADHEVLECFIGDTVDKQKKLIEISDLTKLESSIKEVTTTYGMEKVRDRMPPGY